MNCATLLAEMFLGGGGGIDIYVPKFVSHIHNCYQTDQYKTEDSKNNRLIVYIVTLMHSDKLVWENVMNYATLYSLKCLFEGGGVLLVCDIYICHNWSHTSIIGIKLTSI